MDISLSFGQTTQIPLNVLKTKTKRELTALSTWSDATPVNASLMAFLATYSITRSTQMTTNTRDAIDKALSYHGSGMNFYWGNAETVVHPKGGSITYAPTTVTLQMPNIKPQVFSTESGYPVYEPRPYLAGILAFLASTLCIRDGQVKYVYEAGAFNEVFPLSKAAFDPKGMKFLAATVDAIFKKDKIFQSYAADATSVGGARFWQYLSDTLNTCAHADYIAVHNVMCTRVLQSIEIVANPAHKVASQGAFSLGARTTRVVDGVVRHIVPNGTIGRWPPDQKLPAEWHKPVKAAQTAYGHRPFLLTGSIPDGHAWFVPQKDGTYGEIEAMSAYTKRRSVGSGGSNGPGVILQCNGFSSLASYTSNRCVLLMIMARNAQLAGRADIDIACSKSEMAYLERGLPLIMGENHHKLIRYVLDKKDYNMISSDLRPLCSILPRYEAHVVAWHDVDIESVTRGQDVHTTFLKQWDHISSLYPTDSTVMMPILSRSAFSDKGGKNVFSFRSPADFQGIYTTLPEFNLFNENNVPKKLARVERWASWLKSVVDANSKYVVWFLRPTPMYSPVSNLVRMVAKGVAMDYRDGEWEPILYSAPVPTAKRPKPRSERYVPKRKVEEVEESLDLAPPNDEEAPASIGDLLGDLASGSMTSASSSVPPNGDPPVMGFPPNRLEQIVETAAQMGLNEIPSDPDAEEGDPYVDEAKPRDDDFGDAKIM